MKLILDDWIVREVIDTLYMARTTFLGITGLDSPQDVAKKSANETAITRRISKAIDIIQQSEQPSLPNGLEEAAETFCDTLEGKEAWSYGPDHYDCDDVNNAFIAGAKWMKEQMLKDAIEGKVFMSFAPGHNQMVMADVDLPTNTKVRIIIVKED